MHQLALLMLSKKSFSKKFKESLNIFNWSGFREKKREKRFVQLKSPWRDIFSNKQHWERNFLVMEAYNTGSDLNVNRMFDQYLYKVCINKLLFISFFKKKALSNIPAIPI